MMPVGVREFSELRSKIVDDMSNSDEKEISLALEKALDFTQKVFQSEVEGVEKPSLSAVLNETLALYELLGANKEDVEGYKRILQASANNLHRILISTFIDMEMSKKYMEATIANLIYRCYHHQMLEDLYAALRNARKKSRKT